MTGVEPTWRLTNRHRRIRRRSHWRIVTDDSCGHVAAGESSLTIRERLLRAVTGRVESSLTIRERLLRAVTGRVESSLTIGERLWRRDYGWSAR
jgi:hypothetical protein